MLFLRLHPNSDIPFLLSGLPPRPPPLSLNWLTPKLANCDYNLTAARLGRRFVLNGLSTAFSIRMLPGGAESSEGFPWSLHYCFLRVGSTAADVGLAHNAWYKRARSEFVPLPQATPTDPKSADKTAHED